MTGVAIMVVDQCRRILAAATRATAMAVHAMAGHEHHLHPVLFEAKPFPGQATVAAQLRAPHPRRGRRARGRGAGVAAGSRIPCAARRTCSACWPTPSPGSSAGWRSRAAARPTTRSSIPSPARRSWAATSTAGTSPSPWTRSRRRWPRSPICATARRRCWWIHGSVAGFRPSSRRPVENGFAPRHGFKGMQITLSALTAEALQASMPVASFSRSTESHNQDKVSMGTIAAREALRVCELVGHAVAVHLLVGGAGVRAARRPAGAARRSRRPCAAIRGLSPALADDRPARPATSRRCTEAVATGALGQPLPAEA